MVKTSTPSIFKEGGKRSFTASRPMQGALRKRLTGISEPHVYNPESRQSKVPVRCIDTEHSCPLLTQAKPAAAHTPPASAVFSEGDPGGYKCNVGNGRGFGSLRRRHKLSEGETGTGRAEL